MHLREVEVKAQGGQPEFAQELALPAYKMAIEAQLRAMGISPMLSKQIDRRWKLSYIDQFSACMMQAVATR